MFMSSLIVASLVSLSVPPGQSDGHSCEHCAAVKVVNPISLPAMAPQANRSGCDLAIQLHIVVDHALAQSQGAGLDSFVQLVFSEADDIWSKPTAVGGAGIDLILAGVTVFDVQDPWATTTDPLQLLASLQSYSQNTLPIDGTTRDMIMMITGQDLDGSNLGLAYMSTIGTGNAVGLTQATPGLTEAFVGTGLAHQIGHAMSAEHDGSGNTCVPTGYVMSGFVQINVAATEFTSCSHDYFSAYIGSNPNALLALETPCMTCTADVNGDGMLSPADFSAWVSAFNAMAPECDQNEDGNCSPADFSAWVANYNAGC